MSPTLEDQISCVRRELGFRERLYPRWVADGRMTQKQADDEITTMRAVLRTLLAAAGDRGDDLFRVSA